ncbi:uncharacterized protein SRS1_14168 [Sporisorium reilianum f. sp. reilianum]|uniref:Uncharacterized protein n=1 Tax=Sporisorium reilianum f. sp. reilianum TaxID=72559 RepID=A0A2N8UF13_9BASI|nr:uncharacterized protein SRS1_14168 [Sporisorium reilianum f. sp. reilianum]
MVKLHHSFLLAALGIAATASAAAIANGGEQVTDLARRFVDKHAETLAARQHDKHRRSLYPDDTLEPSASKQKFEAILFAELDKQLDEQFATVGHCSGPESPTCQHNSCMLGDAGCTAYSRDEQRELSARTKQLVLMALTLGKCTPSSANAEYCNELGYCDYWQWHRKVDQTVGCEPLDERDQQQLFAKLRPQPDGTYDFVDNVKAHDDEGSTRASSDEPRAKKVPRTFGKRSLASNDERVSPQEAPETQAADDTVEYFGTKLNKNQLAQEVVNAAAQVTDITYKQYGRCAPDSDSCQRPICKRRHSGCLPFSEEKKAEIEENFIAIYAKVLFSGSCDPATGSKNNNCDEEGRCELWTDDGKRNHDCKSLDQMEMIDRLHAELQQLDALGAQNEGHAGSDSHSDKVKPHVSSDEGAQTATFHGVPMTKEQVDLLAEQAAEQATTITFNGFGYCDEASTTCREETCHLNTEGCIAYPSEVIDEYEYKVAALYRRVFSSGFCDASAAAAAATVDSESSNCDENGQCKLWLKNGSRDPRCKPLRKKQLVERLQQALNAMYASGAADTGPSVGASDGTSHKEDTGADKAKLQKRGVVVGQHLLKRDYSMAEPEPHGDDAAPTTPPAGFITVNKADLLSSAKLYQPTPEELDDFMAVCAQLASDPEALDQIAEDAGVDDDDAKQLLREHFAELAHDKDAATQVMQQAKMAQMVRESKGTGASTNDAAVGAAAVAKLRKAGGAGAGGTGAAANAELGSLKVDDHGGGSAAQ